jgi:hypothetical protein
MHACSWQIVTVPEAACMHMPQKSVIACWSSNACILKYHCTALDILLLLYKVFLLN